MRKPWKLGLLIAPVAIVLLDDVAFKAIGEPTISTEVREGSKAHPIIPFLIGIVYGGLIVHLFLYEY